MTLLPADVNEFTEETRQAPPMNLQVEIKPFSLLAKNGIEKYKSRAFEAGGYKWKLSIHFDDGDDKNEEDGHYVGTCLSVAETKSLPVDWEVNAVFTIFLYNQISDTYLCFPAKPCRFHAVNSMWGSSKMICKKMLMDPSNGYLVRDTCVIGAEVVVIKSQDRVIERLSLLEYGKPYQREWNIPDVSKLGGEWTSPEFRTAHHQWRISLYPNGDNYNDDRYVAIYLELVEPSDQSVNVDCCFTIKNNHHTNAHLSKTLISQWFKPGSSHGFPEFMEAAKMCKPREGFVSNDSLLLHVKISVLATGDYYGPSAD